jgi:hypothetical protein
MQLSSLTQSASRVEETAQSRQRALETLSLENRELSEEIRRISAEHAEVCADFLSST